MMVNYAVNVLGITIERDSIYERGECNAFSDLSEETEELKDYITLACQL
jgi:hypothetical protein